MGLVSQSEILRSIGDFLNDLRTFAEADAAVYLTFHEHREEPIVSSVVRSGHPRNWGLLRNETLPEGFDHDESDEALGMRSGQWCLRAPKTRHLNRFCWLEEDIGQIAPWRRTRAYETLYLPNDFTSHYRAMLVDDGAVVGWCGLFWRGTPERDRVAALVAPHIAELRGFVEGARDRREKHRVLLDDEGDILDVDLDARQVFEPSDLRELSRRVRRRDAAGYQGWAHDGWDVSCIPMHGKRGDTTLVVLEPLDRLRVDVRRALTTLQHEIAELVADGKSNAQVATAMGVSTNTIKYHLKQIYPLLGVSNRVELASFMFE